MAKRKKRELRLPPEYTLPDSVELPKYRVLAMDPGSRNFGIAAVGTDGRKPIVLANAQIRFPVNDLVKFADRREMFLEEIIPWFDRFKPRALVAERFQTRGGASMGPLIEQVSVMLGIISMITVPLLPIRLITASTWKNAFNRRHQCDLKEIYPTVHTEPHPFDASLIGVWALETGLKHTLDYSVKSIIRQVEQSSLVPLKVRRK